MKLTKPEAQLVINGMNAICRVGGNDINATANVITLAKLCQDFIDAPDVLEPCAPDLPGDNPTEDPLPIEEE